MGCFDQYPKWIIVSVLFDPRRVNFQWFLVMTVICQMENTAYKWEHMHTCTHIQHTLKTFMYLCCTQDLQGCQIVVFSLWGCHLLIFVLFLYFLLSSSFTRYWLLFPQANYWEINPSNMFISRAGECHIVCHPDKLCWKYRTHKYNMTQISLKESMQAWV